MAHMGRPRTFDRDVAIDQALHLFWAQGYESTSLSQLKAAIGGGIAAPSFYAAFGSKEALYQACVARYLATYGQVTECLWDDTVPPRQAIEQALLRSARMQCEDTHPKGCMVGLGAMSATSPAFAQVSAPLTRSRARTRAGFKASIDKAIATGELRSDTDSQALSVAFDGFLIGMSTLARDGIGIDTLEATIALIMRLWDDARSNP